MRRFGLFILVMALSFLSLGSPPLEKADSPDGTVRMFLFYSGESESSRGVTEGLLPALREVYIIEVRSFDVDIPKNYSLLMALEKRSGKEGVALPVIFVGEDVIAGEEEIVENLESIIAGYEVLGGSEFPALPEIKTAAARTLSHPVYLAYFYERGCPECDRVFSMLTHLKTKYPDLVVREINIDTAQGKLVNESLSERMSVPEAIRLTTPSVFFVQDALVGGEIRTVAVEGLIEKYGALPEMGPPWQIAKKEKDLAKGRIVDRFRTLGLPTVLAAGLLDGVNPCAFATLIFFVSYLTVVGRARREILAVGFAFSLSVFVTYFLVGLGLLKVVQSLSVVPIVARVIYLGAIGLALVLGILSLYDFIVCRKGRLTGMVLQMPAFLKNRVRGVIRKEVRMNRYILAAITTGFVVSILELACTGQVYLPTILFVSKAQEFRATAIGYLAAYNLMFIIPLLVVFYLVYLGIGSEKLTVLFQRHVSSVKLATALLFFTLAGVLALSLL
jgi:cytochrome c biogenesis protein CcdA